MEINPATVFEAKAKLLREFGVTRGSVGVQSWHPHHLQKLGRDHDPETARATYEVLRQAEFPDVNLD